MWSSLIEAGERGSHILLPVCYGDQVVPVVNPKGLSETVEHIWAVILPLERWKFSTGRHVLHYLLNREEEFSVPLPTILVL